MPNSDQLLLHAWLLKSSMRKTLLILSLIGIAGCDSPVDQKIDLFPQNAAAIRRNESRVSLS